MVIAPAAAPATLIFVYNAPDGIGAALIDAVHKIVSPATYACSLCMITYGAVAMRPEWRAYLRSLPFATAFYHRDGFARAYPALAGTPLPAILLAEQGRIAPLLDAATLDTLPDIPSLIAALDAAIEQRAIVS